jgi:hypothetical protein
VVSSDLVVLVLEVKSVSGVLTGKLSSGDSKFSLVVPSQVEVSLVSAVLMFVDLKRMLSSLLSSNHTLVFFESKGGGLPGISHVALSLLFLVDSERVVFESDLGRPSCRRVSCGKESKQQLFPSP